jgi:hypothetical protein
MFPTHGQLSLSFDDVCRTLSARVLDPGLLNPDSMIPHIDKVFDDQKLKKLKISI